MPRIISSLKAVLAIAASHAASPSLKPLTPAKPDSVMTGGRRFALIRGAEKYP